MHVPDGYLSTPVCAATAVVAVGGLAYAARRSRGELTQSDGVPLAGLVATLIFAGQMVNFGVGSGTSGHLLGGALAAVLLGPGLGTIAVTGVLIVQAVFFADGGISALGVNVTLMSLVGVATGWAVFRLIDSRFPTTSAASVSVASGVGAFVSVPVAAFAFTVLYALGGHHDVPLSELASDMIGTHAVIGLGEGVITAVVVGAISLARPDLVYGLRRRARVEGQVAA